VNLVCSYLYHWGSVVLLARDKQQSGFDAAAADPAAAAAHDPSDQVVVWFVPFLSVLVGSSLLLAEKKCSCAIVLLR
jgi:hypothetical protein